MVLVDILENVPPTLESLSFSSITFDRPEKRKSKPVQHSRLKKLCLSGAMNEGTSLESWNEGFKSILNACLNLEEFIYYTNISSWEDYIGSPGGVCFRALENGGALDIDFRGLKKLQKINLNINAIEYYTMNQADKQGRKWKTFEKTFDKESSGYRCHINLLWDGNPSVELTCRSY